MGCISTKNLRKVKNFSFLVVTHVRTQEQARVNHCVRWCLKDRRVFPLLQSIVNCKDSLIANGTNRRVINRSVYIRKVNPA